MAQPANAGDAGLIPELGRSPGERNGNPLQNDCLEKPHRQEEPGRLQSMGSQRVGYDLVTEQQQCIPERPRIYYCSSIESFCFVGFAKKESPG